MLSPDQLDRLRTVFPGFKDPALLRQLEARGQYVRLDAAQTICHQGDSCSHLALVTEGLARVYKLAETGREITLYRVTPGECCILTASCILSGQHFPAYATSESPVEGVLVPVDAVTAWMGSHPAWRDFIWKTFAGVEELEAARRSRGVPGCRRGSGEDGLAKFREEYRKGGAGAKAGITPRKRG